MGLVELQLPRRAAYVGLARSIVTAGARLEGMPEGRLEDLKIAVSEAAAYAISATADGDPLLFAFGLRDGAFEVHVLGPLLSAAEGLGEWPAVGGMGLRLIEGLADEVRFGEESRSQLVLRFAMPGVGTAADAAVVSRPAR